MPYLSDRMVGEQNEEMDTQNIVGKVKIIIPLRPILVSVFGGHILSLASLLLISYEGYLWGFLSRFHLYRRWQS